MTAAEVSFDVPNVPWSILGYFIAFGTGVLCAVVVPSIRLKTTSDYQNWKSKSYKKRGRP